MTSAAFAGTLSLAFGAGVATFFSPCSYALLPGYVGYYVSVADDEGEDVLRGTASRGLAAVLGVAAVFALIGVAVVLARPLVEPAIRVLEPLVGVAFVGFGLVVVANRGAGWHVALPERRASLAGFAVFGAVYAVAAAGCVAPVFLAIVVRAVSLPTVEALAVLGAYAAGFGVLFLAATVAIGVGRDALLQRLAGHTETMFRAAGVVLVLAGLGQLYVALAL